MITHTCSIKVVEGSVICNDTLVPTGSECICRIDDSSPMCVIRSNGSIIHTDGNDRYVCALIHSFDSPLPPLRHDVDYYTQDNDDNDSIRYNDSTREMVGMIHSLSSLHDRYSMMMIGDKNTGKSSLCSYICNSIRMSDARRDVYIVDIDVGQPMYHMYGYVYIIKMNHAIMSNTSRWFDSTVLYNDVVYSSYVGDYTPDSMYSIYMNKIRDMYAYIVNNIRRGTILYNICGYTHGIGIEYIRDILRIHADLNMIVYTDSSMTHHTSVHESSKCNIIRHSNDHVYNKISIIYVDNTIYRRSSSHNTRHVRQDNIYRYFTHDTGSYRVHIDRIVLHTCDNDSIRTHRIRSDDTSRMISIVGSVSSISLRDGFDVPALIEDIDMDTCEYIVRMKHHYGGAIPTTVHIMNSQYMYMDHVDEHNSKTYWYGPNIGVGSKPIRRVVSRRR